ncbi:MAG: OB-fold putative lipoprotein [Bacteroidota bacterium]|nr:OB-fold putative lipoprotein [Bacteroidota bacterium]
MKKLIIPILVLFVFGAGIGYYMYNKPVASLESKKADVIVSADQILADYESDEKSANDKYLGKVVQVNGKVATVTSEEGKHKIQLETSNPIALVICEVEDGKDPGQLKAGDMASIKGMCTGYLSDVILVQSTVVHN